MAKPVLIVFIILIPMLLQPILVTKAVNNTITTKREDTQYYYPEQNPYRERYRPLRAGTQIAFNEPLYCSIGYPAYYDKWVNLRLMRRFYGIVTAHHCFSPNNEEGLVYQPTISLYNLIGSFNRFPDNSTIDAAFVKVEMVDCLYGNCPPPTQISTLIQYGYGTRNINYYPMDMEWVLNYLYSNHKLVWKAGRTTGTTSGYIEIFGFDNRGEPIFIDMVSCNGSDHLVFMTSYYSRRGDSGGIVYTGLDDDEGYTVLGIHVCGSLDAAYATPYTYIKEHVGVKGYDG